MLVFINVLIIVFDVQRIHIEPYLCEKLKKILIHYVLTIIHA